MQYSINVLSSPVDTECESIVVNSKWVMANACVIGVAACIMIEHLGLCFPGKHMITKFFVLHGAMLAARLMFDADRVCGGMDLQ